jgi:hypothetical protein
MIRTLDSALSTDTMSVDNRPQSMSGASAGSAGLFGTAKTAAVAMIVVAAMPIHSVEVIDVPPSEPINRAATTLAAAVVTNAVMAFAYEEIDTGSTFQRLGRQQESSEESEHARGETR